MIFSNTGCVPVPPLLGSCTLAGTLLSFTLQLMGIFHRGPPKSYHLRLAEPGEKVKVLQGSSRAPSDHEQGELRASTASPGDGQVPSKGSRRARAAAGLVQAKQGLEARQLVGCVVCSLQARLAARGDELLLLGKENLHSF